MRILRWGPNIATVSQDEVIRNEIILNERMEEYNNKEGPKVGEYLKLPDGQYVRLTHDWDDEIQTSCKKGHPCRGDMSFYLGRNGYMSFSGSLDPSILKANMKLTDEIKEGSCWFFKDGTAGAHRGVYCSVPLRVFEYILTTKESLNEKTKEK